MIVVTYFRSSGRSGLLYKQITCAGPDISSERLPSDHKNRLQILIVLTEVAVGLWSSRGVWHGECDSVTVWQCAGVACEGQLRTKAAAPVSSPPVCRSWPSVCPCVSTRPHRPGPATGSLPGSEDEREGGGRRVEGSEGARSWSLIFFTTSSSYHWQSSFLRLPGERRQAGFVILKKRPVWATNIKH